MRKQSEWPRAIGRCMLTVVLAAGGSWLAAAAQPGAAPPCTVAASGSAPLKLLSHAMRVHLAGIEELYSVALYAEPPFERAAMVSENVAKALRIEVRYERDWQRSPVHWQHELVPRLEPAAIGHFERAFAPLRRGDVVLIGYAPRRGTTVQVNRSIAVLNARHELMLAFLNHWLGQRPVSEDIKQALLGGGGHQEF